jgi:hypothetical protein
VVSFFCYLVLHQSVLVRVVQRSIVGGVGLGVGLGVVLVVVAGWEQGSSTVPMQGMFGM